LTMDAVKAQTFSVFICNNVAYVMDVSYYLQHSCNCG